MLKVSIAALLISLTTAVAPPTAQPQGWGSCWEAKPICIQGAPICLCDQRNKCFWACR